MKKRKNATARAAGTSVERVANLSEEKFIHRACGTEPLPLTAKQEHARGLFARGVTMHKIIEGLGIKPADLMFALNLPVTQNRQLYEELVEHSRKFAKYGNPLMESRRATA